MTRATSLTQRYRFYVGDGPNVTVDALVRALHPWYDGATLYPARGVWHGDDEPAFVVEVLTERDANRAQAFAEALRDQFEQQSVLFTCEDVVTYEAIQ